jgi:hypothetical protein
MAVALGVVALAVPGTALAKGAHGHGHGKGKAEHHKKAEKRHKHGKKDKHTKKDKAAKKGKTYVFKGLYKGDGVVTVVSGNSRVRKGGYVGTDVTFDLSTARIVAADSDGVPGVTAADVKAGDKVLVQARLPRGTKAPATEEPAADEPATEEPAAEEPAAESSTEEPVADEAPAAIKARKLVVLSRPAVAGDDEQEQAPEPEHSEDD